MNTEITPAHRPSSHAPPSPQASPRAHGEQIVLVKRKQERIEHVWMKAFLWALYLPDYPDLNVEVDIDDNYKPDVVWTRSRGRPQFWGEAGHVGPDKITDPCIGR